MRPVGRRTAADAEELRKALDDRFRITSEYDDRVRRLREAEAAGGITAADRTRLETLALKERDEALGRIERTTRRVAAAPRPDREAEREINDLIRERERLIQQNETAYEKYQRRLEALGTLADRAARAGRAVPDETIARYAREHNGANVLALGSTLLEPAAALRIADTWIGTAMREARYIRRLLKVRRLEQDPE